jgi:hypothetical protein
VVAWFEFLSPFAVGGTEKVIDGGEEGAVVWCVGRFVECAAEGDEQGAVGCRGAGFRGVVVRFGMGQPCCRDGRGCSRARVLAGFAS